MAYAPNSRTIELEGFSDFEAQLKAMAEGYRSDLIAKNTLVVAAKNAMQPVLQSAIANAAYDERNIDHQHMRDTIELNARIPTDRDKESNYVKPTDSAIAVVSVKRNSTSLANEFGTSRMAAHPFLRPALDINTSAVIDSLKSELAKVIPAYAAKLARRRK